MANTRHFSRETELDPTCLTGSARRFRETPNDAARFRARDLGDRTVASITLIYGHETRLLQDDRRSPGIVKKKKKKIASVNN